MATLSAHSIACARKAFMHDAWESFEDDLLGPLVWEGDGWLILQETPGSPLWRPPRPMIPASK